MNEQLTAAMLDLPQELFDAVQHVVIHTKRTGGYAIDSKWERKKNAQIAQEQAAFKVALAEARRLKQPLPKPPTQYEWKHYFTPTQKTEGFGMHLLNYVHDMIHKFKYEYLGVVNGEHKFHKFHGDFLAADKQVYKDFDSYIYLLKNGTTWMVRTENELPQLMFEVPDDANKVSLGNGRFYTPKKLQAFTIETIADSVGWSIGETVAHDVDYCLGKEQNPDTHLTSFFPRWSDDGTEFATYLSGKRHDLVNINSLVNEAGQVWSDYDINMAAINSCDVPADHKDAESKGNLGECADAWFETEAEAAAFSFEYDLDKEWAVKQFAVEISAANGTPNGHYPRQVAWFNLKTGKVMQSPFDK